MLAKLVLSLKNEKTQPFDYNTASAMQGVLMNYVTPEYGDFLHESQLHPYSQHISYHQDEVIWTINGMNRTAKENILDRLADPALTDIFLKHRQQRLKIVKKEYTELSYDQLIHEGYATDQKRFMKLRFLSPVSFKKSGQYCIFPEVRLIFQSLMQKFDACSENSSVFDADVLTHYEQYAKITGYKLKSTTFSLEGVRIPAFIGEVTIKINGPQQMVNMAWLLARFGEFSGVGVKTGMGMGAMQIITEG